MRLAAALLCALPLAAHADTFTLTAPPVAVTAYASGAVITRTTRIDLPAGQHLLQLADMDPAVDPELIDIALDGATLLSRQWQDRSATPSRAPRTPAWLAAKAQLDTATAALAALDDQIALAEAQADAARDQVAFLGGIDLTGDGGADAETLRAIGQLIASDGTAARGAMLAAQTQARTLRIGRDDLAHAVATARAALDQVTPPNSKPAQLGLRVSLPEAGPVALTVTYPTDNANWQPIYTLRLTGDDTLTVERGAQIRQWSNEHWTDVALTLSTLSPFAGSNPGTLRPLRRRIEDPVQPQRNLSRMQADSMAELVIEAPVIVEEVTATADFDGVGVTYTLPGTVTVPADAGATSIALDTLSFDATLSAHAVPRLDDTAYRRVTFDNTTPEILLPGIALLYVDAQLVGGTDLPLLPPGAEAQVFFGPIEGLRLTRTVLNRNEGDRGLISRSNEERETVRLEIENLTGRTWPVHLRDAVPFSEQEDLVIDWQASPAPDDTALDDRRGILEWRFDLPPAETQTITLDTRLSWPEGMILR